MHSCPERRDERRIQALILHIPQLEHVRIVTRSNASIWTGFASGAGWCQNLFCAGRGTASHQAIAAAVEHVYRTQPERAASFARKLDLYENWLARLKLPMNPSPRPRKNESSPASPFFGRPCHPGAPVAVYGWLHRAAPFFAVKWAVNRFANVGRHKAQTATAAIIAGLVCFGFFYGSYA